MMAQIHALTPEGRLPTAAVGHVEEVLDPVQFARPLIDTTTDLNDIWVDGTYPLVATPVSYQDQHYPVPGWKGTLLVQKWTPGNGSQTFIGGAVNNPGVLIRYKQSGVIGPWKNISDYAAADIARLAEAKTYTDSKTLTGTGSIRHDMLVEDMLAYHGGPVGTDGAVPVALTFDDYPREFRDLMKAALTSRGIPYTLALSSGMYDPAAVGTGGTWEAVYEGAQGTTWAEIDGWLVPDGAEVANHSRRHAGGSGVDYLTAEIVAGKSDLQSALPAKPIWCWIQPSANYYDTGTTNPFNNGDTINAYASTIAGKLIWDHHAQITGTRLVNGSDAVPRRGEPVQGVTRAWISSAAGITTAQAKITAAYATGSGLIVGSHASDITAGKITAAQFTAFLDWLIIEQTAGRVRLLTLSQWAVADTRFPA